MFTANYIIIDILDNWGSVSYIGLNKIELLDETGNIIPMASTDYTITSTGTSNASYPPELIFDTSVSATGIGWLTSTTSSVRLICQFNESKSFYGMQINNPASNITAGIKNIKIYVAIDGDIESIYNGLTGNSILIFDNIVPIHINISTIRDNFIVFYHSEYEIKLSNHGRQIGDLGYYPITSGAFDTRTGIAATSGALFVAPTGTQNYTTTGVIGQDFYRDVVINQYKIYIYSTTNTANPNSWTFEGYNGSDWIVLDAQTNQYSLFTIGWNTYSINNSVGYKQYRMNITANGGHATQLHIIELEFLGYDSIYKIAGTTMIDSTPTPSTVRVYNNTTGDYICQQVSNASGVFNITGLPTEQAVNVVCIAPNSTYNNQIYRVTPVLI